MPQSSDPLTIVIERGTARLRQLSLREAAAFAAACAERLSPAYEAFRAETGWDESDAFRQLLDRVWQHISTDESPEPDLAGRSLALTPEGDELDSDYTTAAQDACICLSAAVGLRAGDRTQLQFLEYVIEAHVSLTSEMRSGKTLISGSREELEFQERVSRSSSLTRELAAQDADFEVLKRAGVTPVVIDEMRARARAQAIAAIGGH